MSAYNPQVSVTHKSSPRLKGYKSGTDKYNTISGAFWNSNFFPQTSGKKFFVYHHMIFTFELSIHEMSQNEGLFLTMIYLQNLKSMWNRGCNTGMYLSLNFTWYSSQPDINNLGLAMSLMNFLYRRMGVQVGLWTCITMIFLHSNSNTISSKIFLILRPSGNW